MVQLHRKVIAFIVSPTLAPMPSHLVIKVLADIFVRGCINSRSILYNCGSGFADNFNRLALKAAGFENSTSKVECQQPKLRRVILRETMSQERERCLLAAFSSSSDNPTPPYLLLVVTQEQKPSLTL